MGKLRKVARVAGWGLLALLVVATAAWFAADWCATREVAAVEEEWSRAGFPMKDFERAFPPVETNDTAREVERFAKELEEKLRHVSVPSEKVRWEETPEGALMEYQRVETVKAEASISPPPPVFVGFLGDEEAALKSFRVYMLTHDPPRWRFRFRDESTDFFDVHLRMTDLERFLRAASVCELALGHETVAAEWLEIAWRINDSRRMRPDEISQLTAGASDDHILGILRKLIAPAPLWADRLAAIHARERALLALQRYALYQLDDAKEPDRVYQRVQAWEAEAKRRGSSPEKLYTRTGLFLLRMKEPLWRLNDARYARLRLHANRTLGALAPCAGFDKSGLAQIQEDTPGTRAVLGGIIPDPAPWLWLRSSNTDLHAEMTAKIIQLKRLRMENGGKWPEKVPGIEVCACPDHRWAYEITPDGTMTFRLEPEMDQGNPKKFHLPWKYIERPAA